jgi:predicted nucleotidyltransferase
LIAYGGPLSVSQLAHECCLSRQGTYQTLNSLVSQRLVRVLGQARSQLFTMDTNHPLSPGLKDCSAMSNPDGTNFFRCCAIRSRPTRDIHAAWYYGSVARGEDEPHSDLDIAVIAPDGRVDETVESVRQALREVEDRCTSVVLLSAYRHPTS